MKAAKAGSAECCAILAKVDGSDLVDRRGQTAAEIARAAGHAELARSIESASAAREALAPRRIASRSRSL